MRLTSHAVLAKEEREALFDVSEAVQYVFCSPSWLIAGMVSMPGSARHVGTCC